MATGMGSTALEAALSAASDKVVEDAKNRLDRIIREATVDFLKKQVIPNASKGGAPLEASKELGGAFKPFELWKKRCAEYASERIERLKEDKEDQKLSPLEKELEKVACQQVIDLVGRIPDPDPENLDPKFPASKINAELLSIEKSVMEWGLSSALRRGLAFVERDVVHGNVPGPLKALMNGIANGIDAISQAVQHFVGKSEYLAKKGWGSRNQKVEHQARTVAEPVVEHAKEKGFGPHKK